MAYLVRYDRHDRPVPKLATEVPTQQNGDVSADGLTMLRKPNDANDEIGRDGFDRIARVASPIAIGC